MKKELLKVALRKKAVIIPNEWIADKNKKILSETTAKLVANSSKLGFGFSEDLLLEINKISPSHQFSILELLKEATGVRKNWTPLVKQWDIPTGETVTDHLITWFANIFPHTIGTKLPCGHTIPNGTFPLEKYNGCPFCGTPFEFGELEYDASKNKQKILQLWNEADLEKYFTDLLASPVALDANQIDDLEILFTNFTIPTGIEVKMKETLMLVVDLSVQQYRVEEASKLFQTPNDILRYLWYKHTGFLQIIEPKIIANRLSRNNRNWQANLDESTQIRIKSLADLKLKFNRAECKVYATWLNNLPMSIESQCENMHPKRGMWVRVIRALRLAEYSKKAEFKQLKKLLDTFYNEDYAVLVGKINEYKAKLDADKAFQLLKKRPGLFARSLFSSMLWFGAEVTIKHFKEVMDLVPPRLIFTLNMYAEIYFDKNGSRTVKPLGGTNKQIPANKLLKLYSDKDLFRMRKMIESLSLELIKKQFEIHKNDNKTIFIEPELFNIPIAIGDRSEHLQDLPTALMGTRFDIEGSTIRLFMQWGEGLPAQHLDMDLSCKVAYETKTDFCSYSQLVIPGCKHSGDIQRIPHQIGTAEYIDLDLRELKKLGAKYVTFTCNAYTNGSLSPNLVVGWMNSKYKMKVNHNGVAYNPTAVQHQVRIKQSLTKGMVFGVLDLEKNQIIWLEMSFGGQVVQNLNRATVESMMKKLDAKLKIGDLLKIKAEMQDLTIIADNEKADEVYDMNWALNTAEVNQLFMGNG